MIIPLDDENARTEPASSDRRRRARGTAPDHQHIDIEPYWHLSHRLDDMA